MTQALALVALFSDGEDSSFGDEEWTESWDTGSWDTGGSLYAGSDPTGPEDGMGAGIGYIGDDKVLASVGLAACEFDEGSDRMGGEIYHDNVVTVEDDEEGQVVLVSEDKVEVRVGTRAVMERELGGVRHGRLTDDGLTLVQETPDGCRIRSWTQPGWVEVEATSIDSRWCAATEVAVDRSSGDLWALDSNAILAPNGVEIPLAGGTAITFDADAQELVAAAGSEIQALDSETGAPRWSISTHGTVTGLWAHPQGGVIAAVWADDRTALRHFRDGAHQGTIDSIRGRVFAASLAPDHSHIAVRRDEGSRRYIPIP